jgi:sugar O-acyltransferase (sialic acid O-acetyltransferase NeuD family)
VTPLYAIVGAGGFGREVMPVAFEMLSARKAAPFELVFVDDRPKAATINGHRAMTPDEFLSSREDKHFNVAIADYGIRERIVARFVDAGAQPFAITATNSVRLSTNEIGEGAILCPFTTVTSNVTIGRYFHLNPYSYVSHDCRIGDYVTFAPAAHCNGRVVIEDYAYIGSAAVIKQGTEDKPLVIGKGAIVGMGAVVTKSVPPFTTVVGNPAAPLRRRADTFARSDANS